jgi:hypothetical protein
VKIKVDFPDGGGFDRNLQRQAEKMMTSQVRAVVQSVKCADHGVAAEFVSLNLKSGDLEVKYHCPGHEVALSQALAKASAR